MRKVVPVAKLSNIHQRNLLLILSLLLLKMIQWIHFNSIALPKQLHSCENRCFWTKDTLTNILCEVTNCSRYFRYRWCDGSRVGQLERADNSASTEYHIIIRWPPFCPVPVLFFPFYFSRFMQTLLYLNKYMLTPVLYLSLLQDNKIAVCIHINQK